jgi:hypothetical protein
MTVPFTVARLVKIVSLGIAGLESIDRMRDQDV